MEKEGVSPWEQRSQAGGPEVGRMSLAERGDELLHGARGTCGEERL